MTSEETKVSGICRIDILERRELDRRTTSEMCSSPLNTQQSTGQCMVYEDATQGYWKNCRKRLEGQEYFLFPPAKLEPLIFLWALGRVRRRVLKN